MMEKKRISLKVIIFLFIGICCYAFVFGETTKDDSKIMIQYKQHLEKYEQELEKLKPIGEALDKEKEKGLSFEDKTLRVEKVVNYQLSYSKIWQGMGPRCCGPIPLKPRELNESEQAENKKFYEIVEEIKTVKKGITTKKEILGLFGEPHPGDYTSFASMSPPEIKENQTGLSYGYRLTKIADSYINLPYGVALSLTIFIDKNTDVVDDMWFMVMIWFA